MPQDLAGHQRVGDTWGHLGTPQKATQMGLSENERLNDIKCSIYGNRSFDRIQSQGSVVINHKILVDLEQFQDP